MRAWLMPLIVGILMVVGGIVALFNPFAASLTVEQIAGWFFLFAGLLQVVSLFQADGWGQRLWALILALALLWLGISLLFNPLAGVVTLTVMVAIMFLAIGIAKLWFSLALRGTAYFWPVLLSGALSVILAIMVFTNLPQSAAVLLGVMLAIELISSGATLIAYALYVRTAPAAR